MDKLEEKIDKMSKKVDEIAKQEEDKKPKEEEKQPEEEKKAEDKDEKEDEEKKKADEKPSDLESRVAGLESTMSEIKSMLTTANKNKAEGEKVTLPTVPQEETADNKPETDKVKLAEKMETMNKKLETISKAIVTKTSTSRPDIKEDDDKDEEVNKSENFALDVAQGRKTFDFQTYHNGLLDKHDEMFNKALGRK